MRLTVPEPSKRKVLVWRDVLLPMSETFIVGQMDALDEWEPTLVGQRRSEPSLAVTPGFLTEPSGGSRLRRLAESRVWAPRAFSAYVARQRFELMHAHFVTDALRALPLARRAGLPLVVTAHGYDVTTTHHRRHEFARLFEYASSLIAVSDFIASELVALGAPAGKIRVLNIGIGVPASPTGARRTDRILFVGRLVEKKGCSDLLRAVAQMPQANRVDIRIVGDGRLRPELERLAAQLGLRATFLGGQPSEVVRVEMEQTTVFCGPSLRVPDGDAEGFGMVFLEAAAAETPVVSYRSGGTAEAIADGATGILVPEGDVDRLAAALVRLFDDPDMARRLGAAGRRRVIERFDIRACTQLLEHEYARAAAGAQD